MDELIAEEVFAGVGEAVVKATFVPAHYSTLHIFHFTLFPDAWLSLFDWNIEMFSRSFSKIGQTKHHIIIFVQI